jgi:GNAT superfamily N-acetyltransferase
MELRLATIADLPVLRAVMDAAIAELQKGFLSEEQIESSRTIMGLDTQLVEDGTYFVVEDDGEVVGCGGWSRRATLYGSDSTAGLDAHLLDPGTDAARVRAMYTHPRHARRGVGWMILEACEEAAAAEGFTRMSLMATLSGVPLYEGYGFVEVERVPDARTSGRSSGAPVPCIRMEAPIRSRPAGRARPSPSPPRARPAQ